MATIALSSKHQDLLKAYIEVSKSSKPDWTIIATKADFPTSKYARDQYTIVKKKLLATTNGDPINLSDRQIALLKSTIEVMKTETDWDKVASASSFPTAKYARDQWTIVRTKLCGGKASGDAASTPGTPTKRKAGKTSESRKRKKSDEDENVQQDSADEDELLKSTPTPTPKRKKSRKIKAEETTIEGDGGEKDRITPVSSKPGDGDTDSQLHDYLEGSHFDAEMFAFV